MIKKYSRSKKGMAKEDEFIRYVEYLRENYPATICSL